MARIAVGLVFLLLAWPAAADDDKAKDKPKEQDQPKTPAEQFQALVKEYNEAQQAFMKEYRAAKTQEERQKIVNEKQPQPDKFAPMFVELAEKNPKDEVAVDALTWVLTNTFAFGPAANDSPRAKAIAQITRDHLQSKKLGMACQMLGNRGYDKETESLLRAILDKNPNEDVQAEACLALAQMIGQRAEMASRLGNPEKLDLAKVESESEQLYKQLAEKHLSKMHQARVDQLLMQLVYNPNKSAEVLLHALADEGAKDAKPEIRGKATLALAQMLKKRADAMPETDAKAIEKVQQDSEKLYERVIEKYADVKAGFRGDTIGDQAKNELFEMKFLSKGKPAPDIEAEDLDGKQFKLNDYKGKVVLLDFWGNW